MKKGLATRIFISLIGAVLLTYSIASPLLGILGQRESAVITSVRRQGGERDETIRGRYTYSLGYTFTLEDGRQIDGTSTYVSDSVFLKADGTSSIYVRYLAQNPYINLPEKDTIPSFGQLAIGAAGIVLIYVMNKKPKKSKRKNKIEPAKT